MRFDQDALLRGVLEVFRVQYPEAWGFCWERWKCGDLPLATLDLQLDDETHVMIHVKDHPHKAIDYEIAVYVNGQHSDRIGLSGDIENENLPHILLQAVNQMRVDHG